MSNDHLLTFTVIFDTKSRQYIVDNKSDNFDLFMNGAGHLKIITKDRSYLGTVDCREKENSYFGKVFTLYMEIFKNDRNL